MSSVIFAYPGHEDLANHIANQINTMLGQIYVHTFPDGETLVRIDSDVKGKQVILVCSLDRPDHKAMALMFLAKTAKELGAKSVILVAPYLGYMRQDKRFNDGEAITSAIFAQFISNCVDAMITIDPHLHRYKSMTEIYSIPVTVLHATSLIADWVQNNVTNALLIGPDEESYQWVSQVATEAKVPFTVLTKIRHSDHDVSISIPDLVHHQTRIPVLIDDMMSTAKTMMGAVHHLHVQHTPKPICIGVHAVFSGNAYDDLLQSDVAQIVTCNTIPHTSNNIDISKLISQELLKLS